MKRLVFIIVALFIVSLLKPTYAQVTNSTNDGNSDFSFENIVTLTAGIAVAIGLPISLITTYFGRRKQRMESLIEFFKILNADDHREARRMTYSAFKEYHCGKKGSEIFHLGKFRKYVSMVRADMDQIGTLYHHNLFPRKIFLEAYWNTVLLCWEALRDNIESERLQRGYPTYMKYFEELKDKCKSYGRKYHPEVKPNIV
jgi:hypothetical protein